MADARSRMKVSEGWAVGPPMLFDGRAGSATILETAAPVGHFGVVGSGAETIAVVEPRVSRSERIRRAHAVDPTTAAPTIANT